MLIAHYDLTESPSLRKANSFSLVLFRPVAWGDLEKEGNRYARER